MHRKAGSRKADPKIKDPEPEPEKGNQKQEIRDRKAAVLIMRGCGLFLLRY